MVAKSRSQEVRIIGGKWRGRKLRFPAQADLRPTLGRTRETLFNWLRPHLAGSICLDLFAGSGVLGFEALSQGAAHVCLVEHNRRACEALHNSRAMLACEAASEVVCMDARRYLRTRTQRFDVAFLDPPFGHTDLLHDTLKQLSQNPVVARVYAEARDAQTLETAAHANGFEVLKSTRAGDAHACLLAPAGTLQP